MRCERFNRLNKEHPGALLGYADIFVDQWGVVIKGISIFAKEGAQWAGMPGSSYTNKEGEKKFAPFLVFPDRDTYTSFSKAAIKAVNDWCMQTEGKPLIAPTAAQERRRMAHERQMHF